MGGSKIGSEKERMLVVMMKEKPREYVCMEKEMFEEAGEVVGDEKQKGREEDNSERVEKEKETGMKVIEKRNTKIEKEKESVEGNETNKEKRVESSGESQRQNKEEKDCDEADKEIVVFGVFNEEKLLHRALLINKQLDGLLLKRLKVVEAMVKEVRKKQGKKMLQE
jgi:hypothetical protein